MSFLKLFKNAIYNEESHVVANFLGVKFKFKRLRPAVSSRYVITGSGNKVFVVENNKTKELKNSKIKGLNIDIDGNNNIITIELPINIINSNIIIRGNNNNFAIGKTKYPIENTNFLMSTWGNNRQIKIGRDFSILSSSLIWLEENNSSIEIGNDCMLSHNLYIRNSDGHVILDKNNRILNKANKIKIGNHVWIGAYSTILKNSTIPDNCIVGIHSLINKEFNEENCTIAGIPAKVVKREVYWIRDNMNNYITKQERSLLNA